MPHRFPVAAVERERDAHLLAVVTGDLRPVGAPASVALVDGDTPSTKAAAATLAKISGARHVLVVAERGDELTWKSLRNVPSVHLLEPGQLNTYDVLVSDDVVFTQGALEAFLAGPAKGKSVKATATSTEAEDTGAEAASTEGEEA